MFYEGGKKAENWQAKKGGLFLKAPGPGTLASPGLNLMCWVHEEGSFAEAPTLCRMTHRVEALR